MPSRSRSAFCPSFGALWGYGTEEELKAAGCLHFAISPDAFRRTYVEADSASLLQQALLATR
jgi:hypothetical protein